MLNFFLFNKVPLYKTMFDKCHGHLKCTHASNYVNGMCNKIYVYTKIVIHYCFPGKVVTFETPLMFSRCSSLGSISSCEPPDDRSSVVSEFR